jgi:hypothetical protein
MSKKFQLNNKVLDFIFFFVDFSAKGSPRFDVVSLTTKL